MEFEKAISRNSSFQKMCYHLPKINMDEFDLPVINIFIYLHIYIYIYIYIMYMLYVICIKYIHFVYTYICFKHIQIHIYIYIVYIHFIYIYVVVSSLSTLVLLDQYSRIGGKIKIRLEKPAINNFKAYEWQKRKTQTGVLQ